MTTKTIFGQVVCPTTDAPTQGTNISLYFSAILQGHPDNSSVIYIGSSSDVSTTDGYPLGAAQQFIVNAHEITNLNELWFLPVSSSDIVAWSIA